MKIIPLNEVPENFYIIELQNGKKSEIYECILTRVPDVNKTEDILVYKYIVPCPVCDEGKAKAYSYDGVFFGNVQVCCDTCGVFFRPISKRK
jgi:hypothetical protein